MSTEEPEPISPREKRQQGAQRLDARRLLIIGFIILSIGALVFVVVRNNSRPNLAGVSSADPSNRDLVAAGQQIYATRCASCHGQQLEGDPNWPQRQANGAMPATPLDASSPNRQRDDQWIFRTIKEGGQATAPPGATSAMPPMGGGLSDEQIWAVMAYMKSMWSE